MLVQGDSRQEVGKRKGVQGAHLVAEGKKPLAKVSVLKAVSF